MLRYGRNFSAVFFFLFLTGSTAVFGQDTLAVRDSGDYYEMSLEQLMQVKATGVPSELEQLINSLIAAASKKPLSARESPGIVTLITAEEIRNSGARDMTDVLHLVPGFDFGVDVEGVVGVSIRGNWAHEGKMLLLIDGQEMNENLFATTQFGNHFAVDLIKRIEIIRGPGSAIYGGYAEYGVINIITKEATDLNGMAVTASYGQMSESFGRKNFSIAAGKKITDNFTISLSGFAGDAQRSDQEFADFNDSSFSMAGNSPISSMFLNLGAAYKELSFRFIADRYHIADRTGVDAVKELPYDVNFDTYCAELKYHVIVNDKLSVTPLLNFKRQIPWSFKSGNEETEAYYKNTDRSKGNLSLSYNLTRKINFILGTEAYLDRAEDLVDSSFFSNGEKEVNYNNFSFFTQGLVKMRLVNIILGARYDNHSEYGPAFVPRLGLTKRIRKFNFKFLYSNAFRAPSIENINLAVNDIRPEYTRVVELEAGYQLTRKSILTANFFDITTWDPIVYFYDEINQSDSYVNSGGSGSAGVELEYRIKDKWGYCYVNYAFYSVGKKERITDYTIMDDSTVLLAFPAHKVNLNANINAGKKISVNPSLSWRGSYYGYTFIDSLGNPAVEKLEPALYINLFFRCSDLFTKGFEFGIGVFDILNLKKTYLQPYNGYHAPLPGPSREIIVKLSYTLGTEKKK